MDLVFAAEQRDTFESITNIIGYLAALLLNFAPALIVFSYVMCSLIWVVSGGNSRMVKWARDQFIATTVVVLVLSAYWAIKALAGALGSGAFG